MSNTSEAGHIGRLRVVRRSWMKLSNMGLKSSSSFPPTHLKQYQLYNTAVKVIGILVTFSKTWIGRSFQWPTPSYMCLISGHPDPAIYSEEWQNSRWDKNVSLGVWHASRQSSCFDPLFFSPPLKLGECVVLELSLAPTLMYCTMYTCTVKMYIRQKPNPAFRLAYYWQHLVWRSLTGWNWSWQCISC